jgi:hypothetical protein
MAYTTIDDPSAYFQTAIWTGNASSNHAITLDGNSNMQPDLSWHKEPPDTNGWHLVDSSRGTDKLFAITTAAETTWSGHLTSFDSNGFTAGSGDSSTNSSGVSQLNYLWKVNGGTTTNLSGNLSSVAQVNAAAGISIVTYTGSGGNGQSVNHGLGLTPEVIITKARNGVDNWRVYHKSIGNDKVMKLDTADAEASSSNYSAAAVNSTAFFVSTNLIYVGELGADFISYCFAPIQGYSKFGKYIGNGSGTSDGTFDGPMVYTGFKPAWLMVKSASASAGDEWIIWDNARPPRGSTTSSNNYINNKMYHTSAAQSGNVYDAVDFLSNGFKIRTGRAGSNASGRTYIYMAFAENPFVTSTGVPATAR